MLSATLTRSVKTADTGIAIGQRYSVIVEAAPVVNSSYPSSNPLPKDGNFWIRTYAISSSTLHRDIGDQDNYMKRGILRYDRTSTADPSTNAWDVDTAESDKAINDQLKPA